ncbi:MAG: L-histidine N(alpha)-methyltransferase [Gemmatimonadaceae bacterium]|jgi:dimethylhistidine N-methyltransferase|nr:L-histidine N(alpha)-methyltransferase [Gemmatimonadaceae bacterium]
MTAPLRAHHRITGDPQLLAEALDGLAGDPKTLPPALFYDARGAALFEDITRLPEYYLSRAEGEILEREARTLAALIGPRALIIEPGSGAARKVRPILAALDAPVAYVPIDVSREQLHAVAAEREAEFPGLRVLPVRGDFTHPLTLPTLPAARRRVVFFPGSTIGNLHPHEASAFLRNMRAIAGDEGALLLGVDRRKDPRVLHAAYNDAAGVTAEFNLNALRHLNRDYGATFDLARFRHRACFADAESRIEMHLEAIVPHTVLMGEHAFAFAAGETIRTEVSYKYDRPRLEAVVAAGGWRLDRLFTDSAARFWTAWLVPA